MSPIKEHQEKIYTHLESCVQQETPEQVRGRYERLFIKGANYEESEIQKALQQFIKEIQTDTDFCAFLSNCCYIAINYWLAHYKQANQIIPEFVNLFENPPQTQKAGGSRRYASRASSSGSSTSSRKIRELFNTFVKSNYFFKMQRLKRLFSIDEATKKDRSQALGVLLGQYPFLYQDCLIPQSNSPETKKNLKQLQAQRQHHFALCLSSYLTSQVRLLHLAKRYNSLERAKASINLKPNPTLLKDKESILTIQHFISGVEEKSTYQDLAKRFITHSAKAKTLKTYKKDLYDYLISSVDNSYGKQRFNQRLSDQLSTTLQDWDQQKPNERLILQLTNQLLKFLVVDNSKNFNHYIYLDLVTNIGPTKTIGLLLKLVLISNKILPYLTSRFAILYHHYENTPIKEVYWLFKSLEMLNIALTVHHSSVDLSFWRSANFIDN